MILSKNRRSMIVSKDVVILLASALIALQAITSVSCSSLLDDVESALAEDDNFYDNYDNEAFDLGDDDGEEGDVDGEFEREVRAAVQRRPRRRNADFYLRAPKKRGWSPAGSRIMKRGSSPGATGGWTGYQDLLLASWPERRREREAVRALQEAKQAEQRYKVNRWLGYLYKRGGDEAKGEGDASLELTSAERRKERQQEAARQFYFRPPRSLATVRTRRSASPSSSSLSSADKRLLSPTPNKMRSKFDVLAIKGKRGGGADGGQCVEGTVWRGTIRRCVPKIEVLGVHRPEHLQQEHEDHKAIHLRRDLVRLYD